ncbi:WecB/TagA/CpsF family glycosyltransferase [Mucilaginibacter myungsuensis]|nr:WecB/TagA/CpsF family glycosyltransferase [Mucilaginibacter myungsuensis]MDN3599158.1 WecB/TagA/CpsF family glycosyltransferase [Mucilaginibacter myungsuensis]
MASLDEGFKRALQHSDILLPDGVGVTLSAQLIYGKKIKKIAGADIHQKLLELLQQHGGRCFYLGASNETLSKIKNKINSNYSAIQFSSYSPPFKPHFSDNDNNTILEQVNSFKPHVLFVGMTAPKQEKWAAEHRLMLDANIICSIGAVFDFYAGTVDRPKDVWIKLGLEWFVRFLKEPKRMWKRYFYYGPLFGGMVLRKWYQIKFGRK